MVEFDDYRDYEDFVTMKRLEGFIVAIKMVMDLLEETREIPEIQKRLFDWWCFASSHLGDFIVDELKHWVKPPEKSAEKENSLGGG